MSGFYGGDTEQMREQSSRCTGGAQRLADLITTAGAAVAAAEWQGPDADAFRERWHSDAEGKGRSTAELLERLARELEKHAEEQDEASASDGGGLGGLLGGPFPPVMPLPFPIPGLPIGPGMPGLPAGPGFPLLPGMPGGPTFGEWFSGNGGSGPQGFYGGDGYAGRGQMYHEDQQLGDTFNWNEDLAPGREIDMEEGYLDFHAGSNYSVGAHSNTDPYGNVTGVVGARGSLEAGVDARLNLPGGFGVDASGAVGMEAYGEAGGTIGPDGYSLGARAGGGLYAENSAALTHESGASLGMTQSAWVGADAHAAAHSHFTRNEDGEVNGFSGGVSAGAFAGAEYRQDYHVEAPNGWFSVSGGAAATAGAGADASAGYTVSTDEVSLSLGGKFAAELGVGGGGTISVNPNAIVESATGGEYNVDDIIDGAQGAWDSATSTAGSALSAVNPFD